VARVRARVCVREAGRVSAGRAGAGMHTIACASCRTARRTGRTGRRGTVARRGGNRTRGAWRA
jgi:hypothetical protein